MKLRGKTSNISLWFKISRILNRGIDVQKRKRTKFCAWKRVVEFKNKLKTSCVFNHRFWESLEPRIHSSINHSRTQSLLTISIMSRVWERECQSIRRVYLVSCIIGGSVTHLLYRMTIGSHIMWGSTLIVSIPSYFFGSHLRKGSFHSLKKTQSHATGK